MKQMPKYVLKNKRLSKTKSVFIFRRNYLDVKDFIKIDGGWIFEEEFTHYGSKCYFAMIIHSDNINTMYDVNNKSAKIKGKKNNFGVFLRAAKQSSNFKIKRLCGCVEFELHCKGKELAYDNGKGIHKTKEDKLFKECTTRREGSKKEAGVPSNVAWSVSHPFQGGAVSPR